MRRKDLSTYGNSPRSLQTRNPGFLDGEHWVTCDMCGGNFRHSDTRKTWDNRVVCKQDWEPRHEQDFVRSRYEDTAAKGLVRPEQPDTFIPTFCSDNTSISGLAIAGCAVAGAEGGRVFTSSVPVPTYLNGL